MYPLSIITLLAALANDYRIARYLLPLPVVGACISVYHLLVENGVVGQSSACLVSAPGGCATKWINEFGYITIPTLALTAFVLLVELLGLAAVSACPTWTGSRRLEESSRSMPVHGSDLTTFDADEYSTKHSRRSQRYARNDTADQLVAAVRTRSGDALIDPSITRRLIAASALAAQTPIPHTARKHAADTTCMVTRTCSASSRVDSPTPRSPRSCGLKINTVNTTAESS